MVGAGEESSDWIEGENTMAEPSFVPDGQTRHTSLPVPLASIFRDGRSRHTVIDLESIRGSSGGESPRLVVFPEPEYVFFFNQS